MITGLNIAYLSECGRRSNNEDMYGIPEHLIQRPLDERGFKVKQSINPAKGDLFVVADGAGGHQYGELASGIAVEEVADRYYKDPSLDLSTSLQRVIEAANRKIHRTKVNEQSSKKMATTLSAVVVHQGSLIIANVGDSRVYLIRQNQIKQLTVDHSWVQQQLDRGQMTPEEASTSPRRNQITRSLGTRPQVGVDVWVEQLEPGDRILLCSDGLSNYLIDRTLIRICNRADLQLAVNELLDTAFDNGSHDNMTVVLMELLGTNKGVSNE